MLSRSRWEEEESKGEGIPPPSKCIHRIEHVNNEGAFRRLLQPPTGRLCRPPASWRNLQPSAVPSEDAPRTSRAVGRGDRLGRRKVAVPRPARGWATSAAHLVSAPSAALPTLSNTLIAGRAGACLLPRPRILDLLLRAHAREVPDTEPLEWRCRADRLRGGRVHRPGTRYIHPYLLRKHPCPEYEGMD